MTQNSDVGLKKLWGALMMRALLVPILVLTLGGLGCTVDVVEVPEDYGSGKGQFALVSFYSCDELDRYLVEFGSEQFARAYLNQWGYRGGWGVPEMVTDDTTGGAPHDSDGGPSRYTTTNVQELGVDEPDIVKTDGRYIYALKGRRMYIIQSWPNPEEATLVSTIDITGSRYSYNETMFLADDRMVVFTQIADNSNWGGGGWGERPDEPAIDGEWDEGGDEVMPDGGVMPDDSREDYLGDFDGTRITVIDISDRTAPEVIRTIDLEGSMVSGRMVDGYVYLALMSYPNLFPSELWEALAALDLPEVTSDTTEQRRQALQREIIALVRPVIADYISNGGREHIIPDYRIDEGQRQDLFNCTDMMRPANLSDLGVLSVVGFDPQAVLKPRGNALLANGWIVYGSQDSLVIAQDSRWWWWSNSEERFTETHLHQFKLNQGSPSYLASGKVPGWLLNQFSISEYEGHLRVATTDQTMGSWWWSWTDVDAGEPVESRPVTEVVDAEPAESDSESWDEADDVVVSPPEPEEQQDPGRDANNVFVLRAEGDVLNIVGEIRGMAPGERIYAVRFLGPRGFVVTFEEVDPLFTLDLSDPTSPQLLGELKIPGFSTYLHPFGDDYLIGVGREGDWTGSINGFSLKLFDVSDMSDPLDIDEVSLSTGGWSYSEAEYDHRAFTFYSGPNLLAVPITIESWQQETGVYDHFSGLVVFRVSSSAITEVARVSHIELAEARYCSGENYGSSQCDNWSFPWSVQMRRSVFIEDYLFAVSSLGVTVTSLYDWGNALTTIAFD